MSYAAASDGGFDALGPDQPTILVVVVPAVGQQFVRSAAGSPDPPAHRRHSVEQGHELSDVVAVAAGQRDGQRSTATVGQDVVLEARPRSVDRAQTGPDAALLRVINDLQRKGVGRSHPTPAWTPRPAVVSGRAGRGRPATAG